MLLGLKAVMTLYKSIYSIFRYKQTYGTWRQFEIFVFIINTLLVLLVIVFAFITKNVNDFFSLFALNAFLKTWTSYHILVKTMDALYSTRFKDR